MTKPIPDGFHSVNVILTVDDAAKAIDFYKQAFGATEISRLPMGDKIGHAELQIGDTRIMLNDEFPERNNLGPKSIGGTPFGLIVYTLDVDGAVDSARVREAMPNSEPSHFVAPESICNEIVHLINQPRNAWSFTVDLRSFVQWRPRVAAKKKA